MQVHTAEEQFIARQLHIVGDADIADVAAGSGGADCLHHQFLGAEGFDDAVGSGPSSEFFHGGDALVATSFDDVCRAELSGEGLAVRVTADGDDAFSSELLRGQDSEQPDGTVSDDGDRLCRGRPQRQRQRTTRCRARRRRPAATVSGRRRADPGGDQSGVGQRDPRRCGLGIDAAHQLGVDATGLVTATADLAGVVGGEE